MANPDRMEWVTTSLCENPSLFSSKENVPSLSDFVVICEVIVVLQRSTQTVFTGVSRVVPEYVSIWMMISAQMRTGQMVVVVLHLADKVSLTFHTQKNRVKNATVTQWRTTTTLCPVRI